MQVIRSGFRAAGVVITTFALFAGVAAGVANAASVTAVSSADWDTCGVLASGEVECWGSQLLGSTIYESSTPVLVPGITDATAVTGSEDHRCALLSAGGVDCWGVDAYGELGNGITTLEETWNPVAVSGLSNAVAVSAGLDDTCALTNSGTVECWGANNWDQLGSTTPSQSATPLVVGGISNAVSISVGQYYACAVLVGGAAKCWGSDLHGDLGDGSEETTPAPTAVNGLSGAVAISATGVGSFTCALISNGTVKCWGAGFGGQLGNGKMEKALTPVTVSSISNAVAISTGWDRACAVLATGSIECWGEGGPVGPDTGVLGNGTTEGSSTPVLVSGLNTATSVSVGFEDTCATLSDGSAWCWGEGDAGGLGDGMLLGSLVPVRVSEAKATAPEPEPGGSTESPTPGGSPTNSGNGTPANNGNGSPANNGNGSPTIGKDSTPKPNPSQKPISGAAAFSLPPAKQCVSKRRFTVHVRTLPGVTWVSAVIKVNDKRVTTVKRSHITAVVNLTGLPKGTFVLSITAKAGDGRTVTGTRTYHTCVPKLKSHYPTPKL
jgi:alpha-tubulin suppressor-like RCC1 family protein